jgi:uncharacterized coiled-coil protein SlyX/methyl-accepting chemotaxis protein
VTIASLIVDVAANTANIEKSVGQLQRQVDSFGSTMERIGGLITTAFSTIAVEQAVTGFLNFADSVTNVAERTKFSTDMVQGLTLALQGHGVTVEQAAAGNEKLAKALIGGDKSAVNALEKMGLSVATLKTLSPDQLFLTVADAVGKIQNPTEQAYASMVLFGKGGSELLGALDGHLSETIDSFKAMGLIIDSETIKAADDFGDQLGLIGKQLLGIVSTIIGPLLPGLSAMGTLLMEVGQIIQTVLVGGIKLVQTVVGTFLEGLSRLLAYVADLTTKIPVLGKHLGFMGDASKVLTAYAEGTADAVKHLWDHTSGAADASAKAKAPLLGLGDAIEKTGKATATTNDEFKKLLAFIHEIEGHAQFKTLPLGEALQSIGVHADATSDSINSLGKITLRSASDTGLMTRSVEQLERGGRFLSAALLDVNKRAGGVADVMPRATQAIDDARAAAAKSDGVFAHLSASLNGLWQGLSGGKGLSGLFENIGGGMIDQVGRMITGGISSLVGLGLKGIGSLIGKLFDNPEKQINPVRQAFIDAAGGLDVLNQRAHDAGLTLDRILDAKNPQQYEAAIKQLNDAFAFQDTAMKTLDDTVAKYGITIDQLGPKFRQQKLDELAGSLVQDYQVLTAAGIDNVTVLDKMAPAVNDYIHTILTAGGTIPTQLQPVIEKLTSMGLLTDLAGDKFEDVSKLTFAETLDAKFKTLLDSISKLVDAISNRLGPAIANSIPQNPFGGWQVPDLPLGRDVFDGTIPMASGGAGYASGPMVFSTRGNEEFAFSGEGRRFARSGDTASSGDMGSYMRRLENMFEMLPVQIAAAVAKA